MNIHRVQVFDPLYHPTGATLPARVEILVSGVDLYSPTKTETNGDWTIAWYSDTLCLFWHDGCLGEKALPENDEYDEEQLTFYEGWINVESIANLPPLFPVTVTDGTAPMRDFFVPAHLVQDWLDKDVTPSQVGKWKLVADTAAALEGQIVFGLEFVPHSARDLRAEHARLSRQ